MRLDEILYCDELETFYPSKSNVNWNTATDFDFIDGKQIKRLNYGPHSIFYIIENGFMEAYLIIESNTIDGYYPLVRMQNLSKIKGLITILIVSLITHKMKMMIKDSEELSPSGFKWICNLIKNGTRGIKITDQNGGMIDIMTLKKEHHQAMIATRENDTSFKGPTTILIENKNIDRERIDENNELRNNGGIIMPYFQYLNVDE